MPAKYGIGFTSPEPVAPDLVEGYRYEQTGNHHNYFVTPQRWDWPERFDFGSVAPVIDGFSPNLNKQLHVGHLRNLALANSLSRILKNAKFVSLLGCSLGVRFAALEGWKYWTEFLGFQPEVYYDCALPDDLIPTREPTVAEVESDLIDPNEGDDLTLPELWDGPNGPVIVKRSDKRPLYAYHDLAFAQIVGPDHYITGEEQKIHFASLGLGDKHLPMGLVLGLDGKKMKSREGDVLLATEAVQMVKEHLRQTQHADQLAWNILAWNFLHTARKSNLKFEAEKWTQPDSPGMYISYTYARTWNALEEAVPLRNPIPIGPFYGFDPDYLKILKRSGSTVDTEITEIDLDLLGLSEQYIFYYQQAIERLDPAPVANYAHDLARLIGVAYERERIQEGRPVFQRAMAHAIWRLEHCLQDLGMFKLQTV